MTSFNISIGTAQDNQFNTGDNITATQHVGLTAKEAGDLAQLFAALKADVAATAPVAVKADAAARAAELEQAITGDEPDPGTVRRVLRWFKEHAPEVAGAVVSVVVNPLVGKAVEGAGTAIAERFHDMVKEEIPG